MAPEYKLVCYTPSGVKVAEVTDFLALTYTKQVNSPGIGTFGLNGNHPAINQLSLDSQIEVWRRDRAQSIPWYADFYGLYRGTEQKTDKDGNDVFTAYCPGLMSVLGRRHVLWYAGTANRSEFTSLSAETVLKTLVSYNAGASATTGNGRLRAGPITGLTVQENAAEGNSISWACAWKNLLEQLQEVARVAGGDFDLIRTGPTTSEFRFYTDQRGTNRAATVTFALDRGNMAEPMYRLLRMNEKTVALVGGAGEFTARATAIRTGVGFSTANDSEVFVDGRSDDTTAKLNSRGDAALYERQARNEFSYKVLQTPSSLYGKHYFLGDLVTATYKAILVTQKVWGVTVKLDTNGQEIINVEMRDL